MSSPEEVQSNCVEDSLCLKTTCVKRPPLLGPINAIITVIHLC